jgi:hypothetical protein
MYPCSGVIAVPVHVYNELRGFDTRIKGWGPEDVAFHVNYLNKYRKLFTYLEGTSHSTYNDPSWRQPQGDNYRFVPPITAKGIN